MKPTPELWTIAELCAQAAVALADYEGAPNGRIRDVPDLRTIRYYTTLGILDRPAQMRGRTALYGRKHLMQLVAIKRLQTQGLSLAEIQQRLLSQSARELSALAQATPRQLPKSERSFWKVPQESGEAAAEQKVAAAESNDQPIADGSDQPPPMVGVPLHANVTLLFSPLRHLTTEDLQALQAAAGPLLKYLEKRCLLRPQTPKESS